VGDIGGTCLFLAAQEGHFTLAQELIFAGEEGVYSQIFFFFFFFFF